MPVINKTHKLCQQATAVYRYTVSSADYLKHDTDLKTDYTYFYHSQIQCSILA